MAKDYPASPKAQHLQESKKQRLTYVLVVSALCVAFYVLGAWQNSTMPNPVADSAISRVDCDTVAQRDGSVPSFAPASENVLDFDAHHQLNLSETESVVQQFPACPLNQSEYTPCEDRKRGRLFDRDMLIYRERHCPGKDEQIRCLIPAPPKYKNPFRWPESRDVAWFDNIPHKELSIEKAVQNWIRVEGNKFRFPGGGTMFPHGAEAYIDEISKLISLSDGRIRTAIDTGCGVASFGAYLLKRNIITVSFAPRDTHEAQVQFALERGVPAILGVMGSIRLPYPSRAFDLAHCSRCLIPWGGHVNKSSDGLYLAEIDRILRPGGYWIHSGPPINWKTHHNGWKRAEEDLKREQDKIEDVARSLCWNKVAEKEDLSIWQKPKNHLECADIKKKHKIPHICKSDNPDAAWYKKMESCLTPLPEVSNQGSIAGGEVARWPKRAFTVPPRVKRGTIPGIDEKKFEEDMKLWEKRLAYYKRTTPIAQGRYRNVMDMNANLGGFAASLVKYPVWVMNVVPVNSDKDTLGAIYERGFIGTYQDWCEAFSTYPRTYDLLHADNLFSIYQDRCDITDILLEMDRILRPEGTAIIRDTVDMLTKVQAIAQRMRWDSRILDHEDGPFNPEKVLVAVKTYWTADPSEHS
uniref:Methyltransferase n=1 Tax=Aegilops tauschii subsp. strangulata TaxID=200361 RepID=A0A453MRV1_AEGTS